MRLCLLAAAFTGIMIGLPDQTTAQAPEPLPRGIENFYLLMNNPTVSAPIALLDDVDFDRLCRDASWVLVWENDSSALGAATITRVIIHEVIKSPADSAGFKKIRCWNAPGAYWQVMDFLPVDPKNKRFLLFATSRDGMLVPLEFGPHKFPARDDFIRKAREACGK